MAARILIAFLLLIGSVAHAQAPEALGWPRELIQGSSVLRYYQPQIDSWQDRKVVKARMAVVLTGQDFPQPLAGALWIQADTAVNLDARAVVLNNLAVERISFAVLNKDTAAKAEAAVRAIVPKGPVTTSLDRLLAGLPEGQVPKRAVPLKQDPPKIYYSATPAQLVIFDGEPALAPIAGTNLQYALNTNWTVINEMATSSFYLLDDKTWLTASALAGPWTLAKSLPDGLSRLPNDDNWKDVRATAASFKAPAAGAKAPRIIVASQPAELIVTTGKPQLGTAGPNTGRLQVVVNTDADLFFDGSDQRWYYLVAGRWFRSASLDGPWSFASTDLPPEFSHLPPDGKKARALYAVPGTPQAQEAVLVASIPQTAVVARSEAKAEIVYHGAPRFEPIEGTAGLAYAVNAQPAVIRHTPSAYYVVDRGVWFAAPAPTGPWTVATSIPPEIYTIPPSSPVYPYTYVTIDGATEEDVTTSFTSGYLGGYVSDDLLYWGTGYYYPPYWCYEPNPGQSCYGPVPGYWPRPYTYGAAAWYNAATNTYYRGGAVYGPYGGFGAGAAYNAATGTYARGVAAYGPYGGFKAGAAYNPSTGAWARGAAGYGPNGAFRAGAGYNPSTGIGAAGIQGSNVYGSWGRGVVTKGDQWAQGGYRTSTAGGGAAGIRTSAGTGALGYRTAGGDTGGIVKGQNNTYVGHDGNVYRKTDSGWQKWDNGAWSNPERPTPQRGQTPEVARGSGSMPRPNDLGGTLDGRRAAEGAQQLDRQQYDRQSLDRERINRQSGAQREMTFNRSYGGGSFPSGGGGRGGGRR